jgi:hypothetical protein
MTVYGSISGACMQAAKAAAATVRSFQPALREITQVSSELRSNISSELGLDELQREYDDIRRSTRESMSFASLPATPAPAASASATAERPADAASRSASGSANGANTSGSSSSSGLTGAGSNGANGTSSGMSEEESRSLKEISASLADMDELQASRSRSDVVHNPLDAVDANAGEQEDSAEELARKREESAKMAWGGSVPETLTAGEVDAERDAALAQAQRGVGARKRLEDMTVAELEAELAKRRLLMRKIQEIEGVEA